MNYQKIYDDLMIKARSENRKRGDGNYYEAHHIIPKCMGGKGKVHQWRKHPNIVLLTAAEHLFAHKILHHIHPTNPKLLKALWGMMSFIKEGRTYILSNSEYEEIRIKISILQSETYSGENHPFYGIKRPNQSNQMTGENNPRWSGGVDLQYTTCKCGKKIHKTKKTCIQCRDLSGKNNGMFNRTNYDVWCEKYGKDIAKQKWDESQNKAAKSRIGLLVGEKNPNYGKVGELNVFYGKTHSQEVIDKNRELAKLRTGFDGQRTKIIINPYTGIFYTADEIGELYGVSRGYILRLIKNEQTVSKLKELFIVVDKTI
jgi:hypothetical protein